MTQDGLILVWKKLANSCENTSRGFKIAASGEIVYVGKRDGQLFQSLDGGENWNDITSNLPQPVEQFNQIVLTDSKVHVATDKGVFNSTDGVVWHSISDKAGGLVAIKSLAKSENTVFGANDDGIYQLEKKTGTWEQIVPEIPDTITSFVVDEGPSLLARNIAVCSVLNVQSHNFLQPIPKINCRARFLCLAQFHV